MNYNAIIVSGKGNDILYGITKHIEEHKEIDIVILDFERSVEDYVSYSAIEKIKNGCFYSPKYKGSMVIFNSPHVICFANFLPDKEKLSLDRWNIKEISI